MLLGSKSMKFLTVLTFAVFAWCGVAHAQNRVVLPGGCGSASYQGGLNTPTMNTAGQDCVSSSTSSASSVVSTSLEASHVLKASAGALYSVYATNLTGGASGYLLIFDSATVPADGAVQPKVCVPFNSSGVALANYQGIPAANFTNGIVAVVSSSTTCFTKTTGTLTAFISGMVQ